MGVHNKKGAILSVVKDVKQMEFSYPSSENADGYNAFGKLYDLLEVIVNISYDPTIPFFGIKSRCVSIWCIKEKTCT